MLVFQNDLSMTICVKREAGVETVNFLSLYTRLILSFVFRLYF